jgi:ABC-2 type transport system ATP-binding protein
MGKTKTLPENIVIDVDHVSMHFNMATEKVDSLRDYLTKLFSHKLFYNDFVAVDDVSFDVRKGEVFGIVGSNGSGKSTMLKMIAGVLKPTMGTITTAGRIAPLIELGAGFDGNLTGRENVYLNGALLGYSEQFLNEQYQSIVEFSELDRFMEMPLKNYSSGMVARLAFAIATSVQPDILLADEILSVGDYAFQQKCEKRIREMMQRGTTVLIVSHSFDTIESLCDRCLWIEKSREVMLGDTKTVCAAYRKEQESKAQ